MTKPRLTMLRPRIGLAPTSRVLMMTGTPGATPREKGRPWRRLRARILSANPLCVHCEREGRVTAATEVDHRVPLAQGGTDDPGNLDPVCAECHARKTASEASDRGRGGSNLWG